MGSWFQVALLVENVLHRLRQSLAIEKPQSEQTDTQTNQTSVSSFNDLDTQRGSISLLWLPQSNQRPPQQWEHTGNSLAGVKRYELSIYQTIKKQTPKMDSTPGISGWENEKSPTGGGICKEAIFNMSFLCFPLLVWLFLLAIESKVVTPSLITNGIHEETRHTLGVPAIHNEMALGREERWTLPAVAGVVSSRRVFLFPFSINYF